MAICDMEGIAILKPEDVAEMIQDNQEAFVKEISAGHIGKKKTLNIVSATDMLVKNYPPRKHLMSPWLPEKGVAMVYAGRGVGKTFFALHVACSVASGQDLMGWNVPDPASVLYIDGEMPAVAMKERLEEMIAASDYSLQAGIDFITNDEQDDDSELFNLADPEWQDILDVKLKAKPEIKLIIVDNIVTVCRGIKEGDNNDWADTVQPWALRMRKAGRTVLFVHHTGKSGDQRGGSGKEDILDTSLQLKHPSDYEPEQGARFEVHFKKNRGFQGDEAKSILVQLKNGAFEAQPLDNDLEARVAELVAGGLSTRSIAEELGISQSKASRLSRKHKGLA